MQHLPVRAVERPARAQVHHVLTTVCRVAKSPAPGLRGVARQGQAVVLQQVRGLFWRAAPRQISRGGHAQAAVVGHAHTDQRAVGQVAHADGAVKALGRQVHHPVAQVERNRHIGVQFAKARHQRGHMAAAKPGRGGDAQMAARLDAARRHTGFGIGHIREQALAIFQKSAAFVGQGDAPGGAHQQLHAQAFLQRIEPAADDGRGHALGSGCGGQAALGGNRDKSFEGFELVHATRLCGFKVAMLPS